MKISVTEPIKLTCEYCGKTFLYEGHRTPRYCSKTCKDSAYNRRKKLGGRHSDTMSGMPPHKVWLNCETYAERQKAKTLEMVGRVKV